MATHGGSTPPSESSSRISTFSVSPEEQVPETWNIGDVILDLYEVTGILGEGGMGIVYKVHHRDWGIDLAVKSPRGETLKGKGGMARVSAEADRWISLGMHPHIVTCHYVRYLGGIHRIFAECVDGISLRDWIRKGMLYHGGPKQALARILDIAIQMAWGLTCAHEKGVIHKDFKPGNVLITEDDTAKVTDFGQGKTEAYRSPEQGGKEDPTHKTDLWSWAVSLLEMFAGDVTWGSGVAAPMALRQYLKSGPKSDKLPMMPPQVASIVARCLDEKPKDRPKDMLEIGDALRATYRDVTRESYFRPAPQEVQISVDGLNNRAVSLMDLDHHAEAERVLRDALRADPSHLPAVYNLGLLRWRRGEIVKDALIDEIHQTRPWRESWLGSYLIGMIHLEQGDDETSRKSLEQAQAQAHGNALAGTLISKTLAGLRPAWRLSEMVGGFRESEHAALSYDGKTLVTSGTKGSISVLNLRPYEFVRLLKEAGRPVTALAVTRDGALAVAGRRDGNLYFWDLAADKRLRIVDAHSDEVNSVVFSPDGKGVVSASGDGTIRAWDVRSGASRAILKGHSGAVNDIALALDGRLAVSGSSDRTLRVWDVKTKACLATLDGHGAGIRAVAFSSDGRTAVSCSDDRRLRVWDLTAARAVHDLEIFGSAADHVAIIRRGRAAITAASDGTVKVWDLLRGRCLRTHEAKRPLATIAVTDRHGVAVFGGLTGQVYTCEIPTQLRFAPPAMQRPLSVEEAVTAKQFFEMACGRARAAIAQSDWEQAIAWLDKGRQVYGYRRDPRAWDLCDVLAARLPRKAFKGVSHESTLAGHGGAVLAVRASADAATAVAAGSDAGLRVWDLRSGRLERTLKGDRTRGMALALAQDGTRALAESSVGQIQVWDVTQGKCLRSLEGHEAKVTATALSAGGDLAASLGEDQKLKVWSLSDGSCVREVHEIWTNGASFSADGGQVYCEKGDVSVTTLASGKTTRWEGLRHQGYAALSRDGCWWIFKGTDAQMELRHLESGFFMERSGKDGAQRPTVGLPSVEDTIVDSIIPTQEGAVAISCDANGSILIWDPVDGRLLHTLSVPGKKYGGAIATEDGRRLIAFIGDTVMVWRLEWEFEPREEADWDKGALPMIDAFVSVHVPRVSADAGLPDFFVRRGAAQWSRPDFDQLMQRLSRFGFGWLRPDGVTANLQKLAEIVERERKPEKDAVRTWVAGDVIADRYEVIAFAWEGLSERVYHARDREDDAERTLVCLRPEHLSKSDYTDGFRKGAEAWMRLGRRPHVLRALEAPTLEGVPTVLAEWKEGRRLSDLLRSGELYLKGAGKALERILSIAIQTARALDEVHRAGVVHQDVKPHSIRIAEDGTVLLENFQMARRCDADGLAPCSGMTPTYASPEQAARRKVSARSDQWSWGLTVLHMFTGGVVWVAGQVAPEVLAAHLESPPDDPIFPRMPQALADVLRKCFLKNPMDRWSLMGEVVRELEPLLPRLSPERASDPGPDPDRLLYEMLQASSDDPDHPSSGIKGYQIIRKLASFSSVYLARRERDQREVVIKLILRRVSVDDRDQRWFLEAAARLRELRHPNLVALLDHGDSGSTLYQVLEYCNGGSVADLMRKCGGKLSLASSIPIILGALDGVAYLHGVGVVHRNLKPGNILLSGTGEPWTPRITGLDLALWPGSTEVAEQEGESDIAGTFAFMPREQITAFRRHYPTTDVWSMAASLYCMLTGKTPKEFPAAADPLRVVLTSPVIPIRERDPRIPKRIASVIDRALAEDPKDRYPSAAEFRRALSDA